MAPYERQQNGGNRTDDDRVQISLRCGSFLDFDRRVVLDDLRDLGPRRLVRFDGEESSAAAHRRKVAVGIPLQDPQVAVGALAVAAVAGDDADMVWRKAGLDQFAEGTNFATIRCLAIA